MIISNIVVLCAIISNHYVALYMRRTWIYWIYNYCVTFVLFIIITYKSNYTLIHISYMDANKFRAIIFEKGSDIFLCLGNVMRMSIENFYKVIISNFYEIFSQQIYIYIFISDYLQLARLTKLFNWICLIGSSGETHRAPYFPRSIPDDDFALRYSFES